MEPEFDEFEKDLEELNRQLGDSADELEDMEEFVELSEDDIEAFELLDVKTRTAVLLKNDMIALLCLKTADEGGAICRVDPREVNPAVQVYDDPENALDWYTKSLKTSRKNGWQVVYDGLPLEG